MNNSEKSQSHSFKLEKFIWALAVIWSIAVAASLTWNVVRTKQETIEAGRNQGRINIEKDIIYRLWNARHGGVYVPVTKETQPNPYLSTLPERDVKTPSGRLLTLMNPFYMLERDIETQSGKLLTLMNPALMTRKVHELAEKEYGSLGHITSLNPLNPGNTPDQWEIKALRAFEQGETEVSSIEKMEGNEYVRLMTPLFTNESCLKCHAAQGYKAGDIRGGISVAIPMKRLRTAERPRILTLSQAHLFLWLMGMGGIVLGSKKLRRSERERMLSEEKLRKAKEAADIANQEKSDFLAGMSHELRTPLNAIIGFSEVLRDQYFGELNAKQQEYANDILGSGKHLLSLINDILDLSKIEAGKMELELSRVKIRDLLENSLVMIKEKSYKHGISLDLQIPGELSDLEIEADERNLKQIMFNLLSNAAKFTADGGEIRVSADLARDDATGRPSSIVISVADTGIGIASGDQEKIFEEFTQLSDVLVDKVPGTGLGLPLTRRFVEMRGGRIWVESGGLGKGSRFIFTLPLGLEFPDRPLTEIPQGLPLPLMDDEKVFLNHLDRIISVSRRQNKTFSLCRIYAEGQDLRKKMDCLKEMIEKEKRAYDFLRLDEKGHLFLLLQDTDLKGAKVVCERTIKHAQTMIEGLKLSYVKAMFPDDGETPESLLKSVSGGQA